MRWRSRTLGTTSTQSKRNGADKRGFGLRAHDQTTQPTLWTCSVFRSLSSHVWDISWISFSLSASFSLRSGALRLCACAHNDAIARPWPTRSSRGAMRVQTYFWTKSSAKNCMIYKQSIPTVGQLAKVAGKLLLRKRKRWLPPSVDVTRG